MSAPGQTSESPPPPRIHDHELLQVIGKGSYGEVWLARNIMGTYRAVKVIYRRTFEHLRPYEREFEGIKRYEPVSRGHPNQVAILQAGRDEANEYYYYVMELADDANAPSGFPPASGDFCERHQIISSPADYVPHTLGGELRARGRLPLDQCISVGLALTSAVENLHSHRLIHRDIKPANVIFVKGVPKLADIGLVAEKDSSNSFVGTHGYFPPEGPGTIQADLYSLGKLLYELSTGKDRHEFPDLPDDLEQITEEERLLEFNEVLLKACHGDVRRRYRTTEELRGDLSLLLRGKSLIRKRNRERLAGHIQMIALAGSIGVLVALGGFTMARRTMPPSRFEPEPVPVNNPEFWSGSWFLPARQFDYAPNGQQAVFAGRNGLSIWDRTTTVTRPVRFAGLASLMDAATTNQWRLPPGSAALPRWSPDSRHILWQAFQIPASKGQKPSGWGFFLGNPATGAMEQVGPTVPAGQEAKDVCWLPDGTGITYLDAQQNLHTVALNGSRASWPVIDMPGSNTRLLGGYSPDGKWLVLSQGTTVDRSNERDIWIVPHLGNHARTIVQQPGFDGFPTWGPKGHSVYFVSAGGRPFSATRGIWKIAIDGGNGVPLANCELVLARRGQSILHPCFMGPEKACLTYLLDEPNTRVWIANSADFKTAREFTRGQHATLSPDGATVYYVDEPEQRGIYALDQMDHSIPRKIADLLPITGEGQSSSSLSVSPDGRSIALFGHDGTRIGIFVVPTEGGEPRLLTAIENWGAIHPIWSPDGKWLAFCIDDVLYRMAVEGRLREPLAKVHRWLGWQIAWSPDGQHIAAFGYAKPEDWEDRASVWLFSLKDRVLRIVSDEAGEKEGLSWHPDSQRFTYHVSGRNGGKIMLGYVDGRPARPLIRQANHWDYYGTWSPNGLEFLFLSNGCSDNRVHVYDDRTGRIQHAVRAYLPRWSRNGDWELWAQPGENLRHFERVADVATRKR
jgi:serine/threonine protein kinase/Tol biopolymer transport system component